jgi:hybrid cluster-associated redox disulfide protein
MPARPTRDLTMADLIGGWPSAPAVLARHGMACVGCGMAKFETVAEATAAYGVDAAGFLRAIARAERPTRRRHGSRRHRSL